MMLFMRFITFVTPVELHTQNLNNFLYISLIFINISHRNSERKVLSLSYSSSTFKDMAINPYYLSVAECLMHRRYCDQLFTFLPCFNTHYFCDVCIFILNFTYEEAETQAI